MSDIQTDEERSDSLKNLGNEQFKKQNYKEAYEFYSQALAFKETAPLYCNRSFCNLKLECYGEAFTDSENAIKIDPSFVKGYYRRASAHYYLGDLENALKDYILCNKKSPKDKLFIIVFIIIIYGIFIYKQILTRLTECRKEWKRKQFEEALRMEEPPSILETIDINSYTVDSSYMGPRLEGEGEGKVTLQFINELTELYRKLGSLHRRYVISILLQIQRLFKTLPNILPLQVPQTGKKEFTLCGDVHGQFFDLLNIFSINGVPSSSNPYLFNGDFTDRGSFSVEVAMLLFSYKLLDNNSIYLLRGNHETSINKMFGFEGEVLYKYNQTVMDLFTEVFNTLPLAALLQNQVLILHGGLFKESNVTLEDINKINRFNDKDGGLKEEILWSDPYEGKGTVLSRRGAGVQFGKDVTEDFLNRNNLKYLVRSHEMKDDGYEVTHGGRCITLFSAANYCDSCGNLGALMRIGEDLEPHYVTFKGVPHEGPGPMHYANNYF
ncbi:hypothetical protein WA158_008196 [Blastocystis sp. Blastoise]